MTKYLLALVVLAVSLLSSCNTTNIKQDKVAVVLPIVEMYSSAWCHWCVKAEQFMNDNDIKYVKHDVETEEGWARLVSESKRVKYPGEVGAVPTFIIGNKIIIGYDPIEIKYTLKRIEVQQTNDQPESHQHINYSVIKK